MCWGFDAAALSYHHGAGSRILLTLPLWSHLTATIGREVTHESRIRWKAAPEADETHRGTVHVLRPGTPYQLTWEHTTLTGPNTPHTVTATVTADGQLRIDGEWPEGAAPATLHPHTSLSELVDTGDLAEWNLLTKMEAFVRSRLVDASRSIANEIGATVTAALLWDGALAGSVVDGITIDHLAQQLLFGGSDTSTPVVRTLIRKFVDGGGRLSAVPWTTYMNNNLYSRAESKIRTTIGDPMLGPRIRRVARRMPEATVEEILATCLAEDISHGEPLGLQRVIDALTVAERVAAGAVDLLTNYENVTVADESAEAAFEQIDVREMVRSYQQHCGINDPDLLWLSWSFEVGRRLPMNRDDFHSAAVELLSPVP